MKTSVSLRAPRMVALLALAFASLSVSTLSAQNATVSTIPVGSVNLTIAAGTGVSRATTILSLPLIEQSTVAGQVRGAITGLTANTITNSNAGWTPGQLSTAATPTLIQITSGTGTGRIFLVATGGASQNTATTLTIDPEEAGLVNLTTVGINVGDTYRLLNADTLNTLFGGPLQSGILAGASPAVADNVTINVLGTNRTYYHNNTQWVRTTGAPSNTVPIRPDATIQFSRLGNSTLTLTGLVGEVPSITRQAIVRNAGVTNVATGFPVGLTLATSGIQSIPGWVSGNATTGDLVQVLISGTVRSYTYNGTAWFRTTGAPSNTVPLSINDGFVIIKRGSTPGSTTLTQTLPYNLSL